MQPTKNSIYEKYGFWQENTTLTKTTPLLGSAGFEQNQFSGMNSGKLRGARSDTYLMYVSDK